MFMGDNNRIPDDIFKRAVAKAREIETSVFEKKCKDTDKHTFSEKYLERMKILKMGEREVNDSKIASYSVKTKSTKVKILLIAAIVMLLGALTVAAEPVREFIFQIKEKLSSNNTVISVEQMDIKVDEAMNKEMFIVRALEYVPEGYEMSEEIKDDTKFEYIAKYRNSDNQILTYEQKPIAHIDSIVEELSDFDKDNLSKNGEQIYLFKDDNEYNIYVHKRGSYVYVIKGKLELEELQLIFERRKLVVQEEEYPRKMKIVPEGYEWDGNDDFLPEMGRADFNQYFYSDFENQVLHYNQMLIEILDGGLPSFSSDGTEGEDISICGEPAKLISDEHGWNTIVYTRGEFIYTISGGINPELLIECLEAVFEDEPEVDNKYKAILVPVEEVAGEQTELTLGYDVVIHADGGVLLIEEETDEYTESYQCVTLWKGDYLNKLFDMESESWIADISKEGYKFTGWTVYEGDMVKYIMNDAEFDMEEGMTNFLCAPKTQVIMENVELCTENISTDELKKIECTDKSFYVIANWEKIE